MKLFPPQEELINSGMLTKNRHLLINMATGSGKTFLAELAVMAVVRSGYKAVCVTPLKALASQQQESWKEKFQGYTVGVFTGDTAGGGRPKTGYEKCDILIMTPERLDGCMRSWRRHWAWITQLGIAVFDEFHLIGQKERGPRIEGTITRLIRLNPFVRVVGLSATMPNADDLGRWLHGSAFSSPWRQIDIKKRICRYRKADEKPAMILETVKECISSGGQSLVFCNSRARAQSLASYLCENGVRADFHHAGLMPDARRAVEERYKEGKTDVLAATSTLEMGLNLPARQVVIYDSVTYSEYEFVPLPVWSFIQRAGRAGRPGLDREGEAVLFLPKWGGKADRYLREDCEPVSSQLTKHIFMQEQILIEVCAGFSRSRKELSEGFLPLTLYGHEHGKASVNPAVNRMVLAGLLDEEEKDDGSGMILKAGILGRLAVRLMLSAQTIGTAYRFITECERLYFFDLLFMAAMSDDCSPVLSTDYEETDILCGTVQRRQSVLLDLSVEKLKKLLSSSCPTARILSAVKMAAVCLQLTGDEDTGKASERFGVYEADVLLLKDNIVRILSGISAVAAAAAKNDKETEEGKERARRAYAESLLLADMLRYQISSENAGLTRLDGIGGKRAKLLSSSGFGTPALLAAADPEEVARIKGIGKDGAVKIIRQAAELTARGDIPSYTEELLPAAAPGKSLRMTADPYRMRRSLELSVSLSENGRFLVRGGRDDHIVRRTGGAFACDCPDFENRQADCKHILCVKRELGDRDVCRMAKKIREDKDSPLREALPSLWFSVAGKEH